MSTHSPVFLRVRETLLALLTLLGSTGTLICCALPITLVTLGLGATVVGLTSAFPWLVALSRHKLWIFAISGGLLVLSGALLYRPGRSCPADPGLARLCLRFDRWNRAALWTGTVIWLLGFFAAYLSLPLRRLLGG